MVHKKAHKQFAEDKQTKDMDYEKHVLWSDAVLISSTKTTTKNIRQRTFFLWRWRAKNNIWWHKLCHKDETGL